MSGKMAGMTLLLVALGISLGGLVLTLWIAARVWKARKTERLSVKILTGAVVAAAVGGGIGAAAGLLSGMGALGGQSVDPSQKARILAEGISEAMNCAALGVIVWVPAMAGVLLLRRKTKSHPL